MANSKFGYVRQFETHDVILPQCYIVVRIDGKKFHEFSKFYEFAKPNDENALKLMNACAKNLVLKYKMILYWRSGRVTNTHLFWSQVQLYLTEGKTSLRLYLVLFFTSNYVALWAKFFPEKPLNIKHLPYFDSRCVAYPNLQTIKDYLSWRYVDTHINNLYNTTFWQLIIKCGLTPQESEKKLCGTFSNEKQEILFSECGINYNNEPEMFKRVH